MRVEIARHGSTCPPIERVFTALELTPFEQTRVVIVGQDPYHGPNQAHGLAFSVSQGIKPPPSLKNIFRELHDDLGIVAAPGEGSLIRWARQGVLLLNTVLTTRPGGGQAMSHRRAGWETLTGAILDAINARTRPAVFVLWGGHAHARRAGIDESRHAVLASAHPSPLSASRGFFGSRPFSRVNAELARLRERAIDWRLSDRLKSDYTACGHR